MTSTAPRDARYVCAAQSKTTFMRWWLRIILTLVLTPVLWRCVTAYLAMEQGGDAWDLLRGSATVVLELAVAYTLPALAIVVLLLIPAEMVLRRLGVDLLIVGVAPVLACLAPVILVHWVREAHVEAIAGATGLAFAYGLLWGLTIREPRARTKRRRAAAATSDPALFEATLQ